MDKLQCSFLTFGNETHVLAFFAGIEFVFMGAAHVHNVLLVNNELVGLEWKMLPEGSVEPFVKDKTGFIGSDTIIAAYAGEYLILILHFQLNLEVIVSSQMNRRLL